MPNWCYTTIVFYSENKEQIKSFNSKVVEIFNGKESAENDFHNGWLGDYVNYLLKPLTHDDVRCRGSVTFIDEVNEIESGAAFQIETETAWCPMIRMWKLIIEKYYPDVEIAFMAEESGCGIFEKYDPTGEYFEDMFDVDMNIEDDNEWNYYHVPLRDENGLKNLLQKICDKYGIDSIKEQILKGYPLDTLVQRLDAVLSMRNENNFLYVNRYEEVDIDEMD